jgi:hypothetical protein
MEMLPPSKRASEAENQEPAALPKINFDIYNLPFQMFNRDKPNKEPQEKKEKPKTAPESKRKF